MFKAPTLATALSNNCMKQETIQEILKALDLTEFKSKSGKKFCTYLTIYRGYLMPPFYLGSTSCSCIDKLYNGSPNSKEFGSIWKEERYNNPSLFFTVILSKHSTRKLSLEAERELHLRFDVKDNPYFINKMIEGVGSHFSEESIKKISNSKKGKKRPPVSEQCRKRISKSKLGKSQGPLSEEHKRKIGEAQKGKVIPEETRKRISETKKGKPRSLETRLKISASKKGVLRGKPSVESCLKVSRSKGGRPFTTTNTITGEVKHFNIQREAARYHGVFSGSINQCLIHGRTTRNGIIAHYD